MGKQNQVEKGIWFMGGSKEDLRQLPEEVRYVMGMGLREVQKGGRPGTAAPLSGFGKNVHELKEDLRGDTYRVVYWVQPSVLFVLHAFKKKSKEGKEIPKADKETITARLKAAKQLD